MTLSHNESKITLTQLPPMRFPYRTIGHKVFSILASYDIKKIKEYLINDPFTINKVTKAGSGTPIHIKLANESQEMACKILDIILDREVALKKSILDLTVLDKEKKSLLIIATKARQWDFLKKLILSCGDRVKQTINFQDETGKTAAHYAAAYGKLDILKLLIAHGADVHLEDNDKCTVFDRSFILEDALREILISIELHPDRSCDAQSNAVTRADDHHARLDFGNEFSDFLVRLKKALYLKSKEKEYHMVNDFEKSFIVIENGSRYLLATQKNANQIIKIYELLNQYLKLDLNDDMADAKKMHFSDESLIKHCIKGQKSVQDYLSPIFYPENVEIVDSTTNSKSPISSYKITQHEGQKQLLNLHTLFKIGKIKNSTNNSTLTFDKSWLNEVNKTNPDGIKQLAEWCEMKEDELKKELKM